MVNVLKLVHVEIGNYGVDAQREVFVAALECLQTGIGTHGSLKIPLDAAHNIVLLPNSIQRKIDNHLGCGGSLQDTLDASRYNFILNAIGGYIDNTWAAMSIGGLDHFR